MVFFPIDKAREMLYNNTVNQEKTYAAEKTRGA